MKTFYTRSVVVTIIALFLLSCGYTKTENDKYPEIPYFPKHTNPEIEIVSLGYKIGSIYRNTEDTFITLGGNYDRSSVLELDQNFNKTDSLNAYGLFEILEDGSFYVNSENEDEILKYSSMKATPSYIKTHPFDGRQYQEEEATKIYNEYRDKGFPDSLFHTRRYKVDSISFKIAATEFKEKVVKDIECVVYMRNHNFSPIFKYTDKELIGNYYPGDGTEDYGLGKDAPRQLLSNIAECKLMESVHVVNDSNFSLIDKAVTGNGSGGGNHFVPGSFYPKGLQYFELKIGDLTTSFKVYAPYLSSININVRHVPDINVYLVNIIKPDGRNSELTHTYIVNVKN